MENKSKSNKGSIWIILFSGKNDKKIKENKFPHELNLV